MQWGDSNSRNIQTIQRNNNTTTQLAWTHAAVGACQIRQHVGQRDINVTVMLQTHQVLLMMAEVQTVWDRSILWGSFSYSLLSGGWWACHPGGWSSGPHCVALLTRSHLSIALHWRMTPGFSRKWELASQCHIRSSKCQRPIQLSEEGKRFTAEHSFTPVKTLHRTADS